MDLIAAVGNICLEPNTFLVIAIRSFVLFKLSEHILSKMTVAFCKTENRQCDLEDAF